MWWPPRIRVKDFFLIIDTISKNIHVKQILQYINSLIIFELYAMKEKIDS
jgi:hypothetical protein